MTVLTRAHSELVVAPDAPILTMEEIKVHCRVSHEDDDEYLQALAGVVRARLEGPETEFSRCFTAQSWCDYFPAFSRLLLGLVPVRSITSITCTDDSGVIRTIDADTYRLVQYWGRSYVWFDTLPEIELAAGPAPVRVTYVAGDDEAPADVKHAAKLLAGHLYENREAVMVGASVKTVSLPMAVDWLMRRFRRF